MLKQRRFLAAKRQSSKLEEKEEVKKFSKSPLKQNEETLNRENLKKLDQSFVEQELKQDYF
jgi:hypothetical protein